jgi:hypothetical protein
MAFVALLVLLAFVALCGMRSAFSVERSAFGEHANMRDACCVIGVGGVHCVCRVWGWGREPWVTGQPQTVSRLSHM